MNNRIPIAICGGGNIAHALVARIGANPAYEVRLLTRNPKDWQKRIDMEDAYGNRAFGILSYCSSNPREIIPGCKMVICTVPSFARNDVLQLIAPWVDSGVYLGSFPAIGGFDWQVLSVKELADKDVIIFGTQRVPCIARTIHYGSSVMGDYKPEIFIAAKPHEYEDDISHFLEAALNQKVSRLNHFLEITLATSNPILHPARMYSIFRDYKKDDRWTEPILFYEHWSNFATEILLEMDREVHNIIKKIPCNLQGILPLVTHYGVVDGDGLTKKIRSIPSFKGIMTPMKYDGKGWVPDFESRYFTEDITYGLVIVKAIAELCKISTPQIDSVLTWAQKNMNKEYLTSTGLDGADTNELPLPSRYMMHSINDLMLSRR